MIVYLIKSIVCSGILLLAFQLLLEKERMYTFNRFYLLASIVLAIVAPLFSFSIFEHTPLLINQEALITQLDNVASTDAAPGLFLTGIIVMYVLVVLYKGYHFISCILALQARAKNNLQMAYKGANLVLLNERTPPHTFFNNIFVSMEDYKNESIQAILLTHELAHAKQKHSFDIILLNIVTLFFWFNPILLLYKKAVKLNHEFLADDAVVGRYNVIHYQQLLLEKMSQPDTYSLSSALNYQVARKRFLMMTKNTGHKTAITKKTIVASLVLCTILLCCSKANIAPGTLLGKYERALKKMEESPATIINGVSVVGYKRQDIKELNDLYDALTDEERAKVKMPMASDRPAVQEGTAKAADGITVSNIKRSARHR